MANHKSALKRMRQNRKRRMRNKMRKTRVKNCIKAVKAALDEGSVERAVEALRTAQKVIDKTAAKGTLHWRNAARKVSRLSRRVAALQREKAQAQ